MSATNGFTKSELAKMLPLLDAVKEYNPVHDNADQKSLEAEVTIWREGREVGVITAFEGDGLRFIPRRSES